MLLNTLRSSMRCLRCANILKSQNIESSIQKRNRTGWVSRRPVAVLNEEIVLDSAEEAPKPVPRKYVNDNPDYLPLKQTLRHKAPKKPPPCIVSDDTYKADGTPNIIKYSSSDRKLSSMMMMLKSRKMRDRNNQVLMEGQRLIKDAISAGLKPELIMFSRTPDIMKLQLPPKGVKLYKIPYATLQLWSNLTTSPGIIAVFACPASFEKEVTKDTLPLTIICDNVREPGNLGMILRAAAGVGCERVILTTGCVDVWESKVLRSAAGAHFRVSISKSVEWEDIKSLISPYAQIFIADNDTATKSSDDTAASVTEAHAQSDVDSDSEINSDGEDNVEDEMSEKSVESRASETEVGENEEKSNSVRKVTVKELSSRLPVIPYYAVDYTKNEVVLIVGGETEGLSYESVELVQKNEGVRVNIPLTNDVESLNTGMALGIVAFEVKRQFSIRKNSAIE